MHRPHENICSCFVWLAMTLASVAVASEPDPLPSPSFRNDVMAVLSKSGCNMGTCHGNAHGKGGLKISLRGQDPSGDYLTLTRQLAGRRTSVLRPEESLLLQKPAMMVPHEGGRRFAVDSREYQILRDWIAAGMPTDDDTPRLTNLHVTPKHRTLYAPQASVPLLVEAQFGDGTRRDVTDLAVYEPSATFVTVSSNGVASSDQSGQTNVVVRYLDQQVPVRLEFVPERPDFVSDAPAPANFIDEAVFAQLERLKINPSPVCDDTTFVRRVFLDLTGLLPPIDDAKDFVASENSEKRAMLIDELLASEEFNDFQALRWADLLRIEEKTLDQTGVKVFHGWIRDSFAEHKPLNVFAAELLAARGSTYKVPPTNFWRALRKDEERAESTAQVFLGIRLQCSKCHNHPFDRWTQDDYYAWSNFFARVDYQIIENKRRDKSDKHEFNGEQIVLINEDGEIRNPATGKPAGLRFLGESTNEVRPESGAGDPQPDRLLRLAAWVRNPGNQRFATTQTNRIWAQVMGRGIIDPIDDFRSTNPPSNPVLLEKLTDDFVAHNFDVRHLLRVIMNSKTYQLSSEPNDTNANAADCFARAETSRLTAEQSLDAIGRVLDTPIAFGGQQSGILAVQLHGVRNGGHRYSPPEIGDRFLALFGKPDRLQTCECERTNETTLAQTFEMVSGDLINELLTRDNNRIHRLLKVGTTTGSVVDELYWAALSREPAQQELRSAVDYVSQKPDERRALEDVSWALMNSNEFLLRR